MSSALHLDFTDPATLHKMAALPAYGWAEALVRRVDPWWHAPEGPYWFKVDLADADEAAECPHCGCSCGNYSAPVIRKQVWVEAQTVDDAEALAEAENAGWVVECVHPPKFPTAEIPEEYLAWFADLRTPSRQDA